MSVQSLLAGAEHEHQRGLPFRLAFITKNSQFGDTLSLVLRVWQIGRMACGKFMTRLLLALALVGLVMTPLQGARAAAAQVAMASAAMHMAMDCCPEGQPMPSDCGKECPLWTVCATVSGSFALLAVSAVAAPHSATIPRIELGYDAVPSLAGKPPPRPPRS